MGVSKPFRRTCRQFVDGKYAEGGRSGYIRHPKFATAPEHYIRAFTILQKDLLELFEYIEPSDVNQKTYSYRTHELLMRVCIEIEANFKAIFSDNSYPGKGDLRMADYKKIDATHRLSSFAVRIPVWNGSQSVRTPYSSWVMGGTLHWYDAYNSSKHSRHANFDRANFDNSIDAICGLVALLSSQFYNEDFSTIDYLVTNRGPGDGFENAIGGYFQVQYPDDWPDADRYDFDWQLLRSEADPFQELTF